MLSRLISVAVSLASVLVVVVVDRQPVAAKSCGAGEFLAWVGRPGGGVGCRPCTACPINEIIRRPCSRYSDTVCGPLYDFEFMNIQRQETAADDGDDSTADVVMSRRQMWLDSAMIPPATSASSTPAAAAGRDDDGRRSKFQLSTKETVGPLCGGELWRIFCYGVISAVFVLFFVVCVVCIALKTGRLQIWCAGGHKLNNLQSPGTRIQEMIALGTNDSSVDRDVLHLETQLYNNRSRQLFVERLLGPRSLYNGNEYLDERYRVRMMRPLSGVGDRRQASLLESGSDGGGGSTTSLESSSYQPLAAGVLPV